MGIPRWIVLALGALTVACDSPPAEAPPTQLGATAQQVPAAPEPTATPDMPADETADATAVDAGQREEAEKAPPARPPKSKVLVPEGAKLVGRWRDTYSYKEDVPVAIYRQDGFYYYALKQPVGGRFRRFRLEKSSDDTFVRVNSEFGEKFEIQEGSLKTRDKDGPIAVSAPWPE